MNRRSAMRIFSRGHGTRSFLTGLMVLIGSIGIVSAATPPDRVNFQGVLRDAGGGPKTGSLDMTFRYFDAVTAGNEIMVEAHLAAGTGAVVVDNGLFNVELGTGALSDGAAVLPGDPYIVLGRVFSDFTDVWIEIEIVSAMGPEILSPRVRFAAAPYALNSRHLEGKSSGEFLDTSTAAQTKAGRLSLLNDLDVLGGQIQLGTAGALVSAGPLSLDIYAGTTGSEDLLLSAGNSPDDGSIRVFADSDIILRSGGGYFSFFNGAVGLERANLDPGGNFTTDNILSSRLGDFRSPTSRLQLRAGNGVFQFFSEVAPPSVVAQIDGPGDLQIDGDLTVSGNDITAATNLDLNSGPGSTNFVALVSNGNVFSHFDFDNNSSSVVSWCVNGSCIAPGTQMQLDESGNLRVGGTLSQNQFDLAESYLMGEPLEPGDVVRLHPQIKGAVLRSAGTDDATVLGVISERPGVLLGGAPFGAERLEQMWGAGMKARFLEERERRMDLARSRAFEPGAETTRSEAARADAPPSAEEEAVIETAALQEFYADHFAPVALAGRVPVKVDAGFGAIEAGDPLAPSPIPGVAMKSDGTGPTIAIALERFSDGRGKVEAFIVRGQAPQGGTRLDEARLTEQIEARTPDPATGIQKVAGHLQVVLDRDEDDEARFSIFRDGEEAQLASEVFRVDEQGNVFAKGALRPDSMDLAELFAVSVGVEEGDLLVVDPEAPGRYRPCDEASDPAVVGVVAGKPGVLLGSSFDRMAAAAPDLASLVEAARQSGDRTEEARAWRRLEARFLETHAPVSLAGTVPVKVDAGYGAVKAGDLLTTSPTPGHAMRADDPRPGIVVGKALESIESGTGLIRMLVMLR